ncbi:hypothetical protein [Sphingomonas sp.]|jgi:hypothetical protein|uniref:hypothetical protein n=1 Tax=Sphingomonas sp. TaxID=28214 RepID=UPI002D7F70B3|nr:hypothetical protein [Sphingomonas sp.]HEU0045697.1 hypothetical protein [Sphingomonas sp.]
MNRSALGPRTGRLLCLFALPTACLAFLASCKRDRSLIVPVAGFPGNGASCNWDLVETALFDYADRRADGDERYRITSAPPLRFRLPATYYTLAPNLDGGPQIQVRLAFAYPSLRPGWPANCPNRQTVGEAQVVQVSISSNLLSPSSMTRPRGPALTREMLIGDTAAIGISLADFIDGFDAISYRPPSEASFDRSGREVIKPGRFHDAHYRAVPSHAGSSVIKMIDCPQQALKCGITMFYRDRDVLMSFPKSELDRVSWYASNVMAFIVRADVDSRSATR